MHDDYQAKIESVKKLLRESKNVLFITGAGISAESGLPTYRGIGGLYNDAMTEEDIPIEEALSGYMLSLNPHITWKHIANIEAACRGAAHNRAHSVIAEMENHFERLWVLTQNVDGFHRDAGSKNIIDIHGDVKDLFCQKCGFAIRVEDYSELEIPPKCKECTHYLRPDVVLFGELLPPQKTSQLHNQLSEGFDVVFSIGTSSLFPYISGPVLEATRAGIPTIEINPGQTEVSAMVSIKFSEKAGTVMDDIWEDLEAR